MQQRFNTFSVSRVLRLKMKPNPALKLVDYGERRAEFWVRSELLITRFRAKGKPETRPSNAQQSRRHTARRQNPQPYFLFCRRFQQRLDSCEQGSRLLKASAREAEASE